MTKLTDAQIRAMSEKHHAEALAEWAQPNALDAKAAEIAALRQDAKRYRYMRGFERTTVANEISDLSWSSSFETQDEIDDAIDDAISQAVQP